MSDSETQPLVSQSTENTDISQTNPQNTSSSTNPHKPSKSDRVEASETSYFVQSIRAIFGFRKTSLTLLVVLTYAFIIILLPLINDYNFKLPSDSTDELPFYLNSAWLDLQTISEKPHPYVSHANDEVHDYILERVQTLSKQKHYITVDDDVESKLTVFDVLANVWNASSEASPLHYFESGNVVVKIEGKDPTLEGVLISAHYDSVPTAYGTTDDGTGIASLLGVLEYLTSEDVEQPLRTIIINFNNNEEFGLYGAVAFMKHPWSKLVKYFVNLEGTGIGDRAILFRTTDYDITTFYDQVSHPFASSIYQEGFATGLVHSETDYRIYANAGLRGFDIAFYKPRSLYHTPKDNIQFTSKNAVWHMLSQALELTLALSNADTIGDDVETSAVFFDFLGLYFIKLRITDLTIINFVLLTVIPLFLCIFGFIISKRENWVVGFAWIRLPISVGISLVGSKFALDVVRHFNPFIPSSDCTTPLILTSSTFLFINYAILTVWNTLSPICDFKLLIIIEVYTVLWAGLAVLTFQERNSNAITGRYLFTILYVLYSIASILGLFSFAISSPKLEKISVARPNYGTIRTNNRPVIITNRSEGDLETAREEQVDENVPLLFEGPQTQEEESSEDIIEELEDYVTGHVHTHKSFTYDWSLQFLILIPLSFILSYSSADIIFQGLSQTMQESLSNHDLIYKIILGSGLLLTVPVLSFAYKLNYLFAILLILSIVSSGFLSISKDPFTEDLPIKFRFAQTINLDTDAAPTVGVYGREGFLTDILSDLPSIKRSNQTISCKPSTDGSELCSYVGPKPYLVNTTDDKVDFNDILNVEIIKSSKEDDNAPYAPLSAEFKIHAKENRYCHLSFNTSSFATGKYGKSPIKLFTYYHDVPSSNTTFTSKRKELESTLISSEYIPQGGSKDGAGNDIFKWLPGIDEVSLHKLSWDQNSYHIGLQWIPRWLEEGEEPLPIDTPSNRLTVHLACYYGEWDDVSVVGGDFKRKVPAYDELLEYTPLWTSWSNRFEGLVVLEKSFTV